MRQLLSTIFIVLIITFLAGCLSVPLGDNRDGKDDSSGPQVQYGGQYRVRVQASHGINQ